MTLEQVVEECKNRHITFRITERESVRRLLYGDPLHMMTDDFLEEIRKHRGAIRDIVLQQQVIVNAG
jgi:hypothetical protein